MRFTSTLKKPLSLRLKNFLKHMPKLQQYFFRKPIDLVFLFGSLAEDKLKSLSDIDIAVLFKKKEPDLSLTSNIIAKISSLTGREDIDLSVLNNSSPVLAMQVLHTGKLLYARNKKVFKEFRYQTIQRYLATQYLRESFFQYAKQAILKKERS